MSTQTQRHPGWVFTNTGAYFAAGVEDEQHHAAAQATLTRLDRERTRFFTTRYVLAEMHALFITRRRNPKLALVFLTAIEDSNTTIVPTTDADERKARAILAQRQDRLYSLTDAISFAVIRRLGIDRAFTFDRNFVQYGFQVLPVQSS